MTAHVAAPAPFGYPPARIARLESERATPRAMLAAFTLLLGALVALGLLQRALPAGGMPQAPPTGPVIDLGPPPTVASPPSLEPRRPPAPGVIPSVPVPVADTLMHEPEGNRVSRQDGVVGDVRPGGGAGDAGGEGPAGGDVMPPPGVFVPFDESPAIVASSVPEYPGLARDAGVEGTVLLWALVDRDGSVREVQVKRSVPLLDEAASAAVARWRFTPALAGGRPVRVWIAIPVRFSLH